MPALNRSAAVIAIHAGAGRFDSELRGHEPQIRAALEDALRTGGQLLERGEDAIEVVSAVVMVLESFGLFNAGYGSALCSDGSVEMSAALMRGSDRAAGAVAAVHHTRHPILGAHAVLESDEVLMIGEPADRLAAATGAEQWPNAGFVTERQRERLHKHPHVSDHGTVGAVCLDARGGLAAATSTGGIRGQPPGRVGDSPLIGAGTWADQRVAVSCTGDGEAFIRVGAGRYIAALIEGRAPLADACDAALTEVTRLGGHGGLIALDAQGTVAMPLSTEAMPRGTWRVGEGSRLSVQRP